MTSPIARWAKAPYERENVWHAFTPDGLAKKRSICHLSFVSLSAPSPWTRIPTLEHVCDDCMKAHQQLLKWGR